MKTIIAAILTACMMTVSYHIMFRSANLESNRILRHDGDRPVMHTFFNQLHPDPNDSRQTTAGMTANAHTDMVRAWQEAWQKAGWDTRILTIEDAKQHPDYNFWNPTIQAFKMGEYDKYCFYRWIAMAAVGGGWMSDYDTLPLHNFTHHGLELPMDGAFVCYGVFVPALLSGNASEWNRMVHRMVDYADKHTTLLPSVGHNNQFETPSDMMSLLGLMKDDPNTFVSRNEVVGSYNIQRKWTKAFCNRFFPTNMRAMHFSHAFVHGVWMPEHTGYTLDDRGRIAKSWTEEWLRVCGRQPYDENGDVLAKLTE